MIHMNKDYQYSFIAAFNHLAQPQAPSIVITQYIHILAQDSYMVTMSDGTNEYPFAFISSLYTHPEQVARLALEYFIDKRKAKRVDTPENVREITLSGGITIHVESDES